MLSDSTILRVNTNCSWKELSGNVIILQSDISPPVTHELNSTSSFIWEKLQIENEISFESLLILFLDEFEVDSITAKDDLLNLLVQLRDKKLLWTQD